MCLIVYSPKGKAMRRDVFDFARRQNSDGIGIMSEFGVEKFLGKKSGKKAWRALNKLVASETPYGLHFRWATHGAVIKSLCHPFRAPGSDAHIMHNGVITQTAAKTTAWASDTILYIAGRMRHAPGPDHVDYKKFYETIEDDIGFGNKFLVYHSDSKAFTLCNEDAGYWIEENWYSNTYSLPTLFVPYDEREYAIPTTAGYWPYSGTGYSKWWEKAVEGVSNDPTYLPHGEPKLLGYYEGIEAGEDATGYYDDGTRDHVIPFKPREDDTDSYVPTEEDKAWLRNQQLTNAINGGAAWPTGNGASPLDKWTSSEDYREMLRRRSVTVR